DDVLLLDVGRAHRECARRVAEARRDSIPPFGARPVRHRLAGAHVGFRAFGAAARRPARRPVREAARRSQRLGRVTALELAGVRISGERVMRLLHLRSTWFGFGELSLTGARPVVVFGRRVALVASVHGFGRASLQELTASGWRTVRGIHAAGRVMVKPRTYTIYRLTEGRVRGPEVGVSVEPLVRAHLASRTLLSGRVLPRPSGVVTVSRFVAGG